MAKETRKPPFTAPATQESEGTGWVYRSETEGSTTPALASGTPRESLSARASRQMTTVADVVTYPASFAVLIVLMPVARLAAWWRQ
jgi:hypothetical protein